MFPKQLTLRNYLFLLLLPRYSECRKNLKSKHSNNRWIFVKSREPCWRRVAGCGHWATAMNSGAGKSCVEHQWRSKFSISSLTSQSRSRFPLNLTQPLELTSNYHFVQLKHDVSSIFSKRFPKPNLKSINVSRLEWEGPFFATLKLV